MNYIIKPLNYVRFNNERFAKSKRQGKAKPYGCSSSLFKNEVSVEINGVCFKEEN